MFEAPNASSQRDHRDHTSLASSTLTLSSSPVQVDSRRLLQGQREVVIRHGGECYRLRHTRNDKLILTK